jgi:hypothetical protein
VAAVAYTADRTPISDTDLQKHVEQRTAHFAKDQLVDMVGPNGDHFAVPGSEVWHQIDNNNAKVLPAVEAEHRQAIKASSESPLEAAKTAGAGVARTLTIGASDPLLEAVSPGYAKQEAIRQEAHPIIKEGSELLGYALPVAGELGLGGKLVKAATAAPRALSAVARAAGEGASGALGKGIGKSLVKGSVEGAIEATGVGVQNAVSERAIHDEPVTVSRVLFDTGAGAVLGGALGGIGGLLTKRSEAAAQKAVEVKATGKPSLLGGSQEAVSTEAPVLVSKPSLFDPIRKTAAEAEIGQTLKGAGYLGSDIALIQKSEGADGVVRYANRIRNDIGALPGESLGDVAARAAEAKTRAAQNFSVVGDELNHMGVTLDRNQLRASVEDQLAKLRASGTQQDKQVAASIERKYVSEFSEASQAPYKARENLIRQHADDLLQQAKSSAEESLRNEISLGTRSGVTKREFSAIIKQQVEAQKESLATLAKEQIDQALGPVRPAPISYDEVRALRSRWDKYEKLNPLRDTDKDVMRKQEMRRVRDALEGELVRQIREKASPEIAERYIATKLAYKDLGNIADVARKRAGMAAGNRLLGLSEQLTGTGIFAGALGAGHALAGGALALAGMGAARFAKSSTGTRIGAELLHRVAGSASKLSAPELIKGAAEASGNMARSISAAIEKGRTGIIKASAAAAYQVPVATAKGSVDLQQFAKNLSTQQGGVDDAHSTVLAQMHEQPGLQQQVALVHASAAQVAADLLPRAQQPINPMLGDNQPPPPESQAREYAEIISMLDKPSTVLERFANGTLTRKHMDVLRRVLPDIIPDLQKHTLTALAQQIDMGKTPSYQTRMRMGILTGMPIDPSDTPEFTQTVQGMYAQNPKAEATPKAPRQPHSRQSKVGNRRENIIERIS